MNNIEEQLWSYIDGTCTEEERLKMDALIASDEAYRKKFNELLSFDAELNNLELEEPPMAFTYRVMEGVRAQEALKPLRSAINKRIIYGIAAFFLLTIGSLLVYTFAHMHWTSSQSTPINLPEVNMPRFKFTPAIINGLLFIAAVCGLYLFDAMLRGKLSSKNN